MTSRCTVSYLRDVHSHLEIPSTRDVSCAGFCVPHLRSAPCAGTLEGDENSTTRVS